MTPKDYLEQVIDIRKEIKCLDEKRRGLSASVKATTYQHDKSYSNEIARPPEDILIKLDELDDEFEERQDELVELLGTVSREIEEIPIRNFRMILDYYYVQSLEWSEVSRKMRYTVRHLNNIHRNALKEFKKVHKDKDWR